MAAFIDTSFFIAVYREGDENHARATELMAQVKKYANELITTTDHVVDETVTFIARREGNKRGSTIAKTMLATKELKVLQPSQKQLLEAAELMEKSGRVSFCDALTVVLMKANKIKQIYSFDSDFDFIDDVKRIC
ncbi:MAG: type II toxin-antitoxin system VapC family toxin [Candidatus Micrarchaeia archaeon]